MNAAHSIEAPTYAVEPHGDDDSIIARALAILAARIKGGPLMGSPREVREYLTVQALIELEIAQVEAGWRPPVGLHP